MYLSSSEIFWKSWWSSVTCGAIVGIMFYAATSFFDWGYGGTSFFDILIGLSVVGSYFGAGFLGWRIADKYYFTHEKLFAKRYRRYSMLTFILLVGVVFSPVSFLGLFWSFIPPLCVLWALNYTKDHAQSTKKLRAKVKGRRSPA